MANVIRLEVFMDNHQTQGYLMKTITKLLVQLEVTKIQNHFKHTNAEIYREHVDRYRARSMPYVNDEQLSFPAPPVAKTRSSAGGFESQLIFSIDYLVKWRQNVCNHITECPLKLYGDNCAKNHPMPRN